MTWEQAQVLVQGQGPLSTLLTHRPAQCQIHLLNISNIRLAQIGGVEARSNMLTTCTAVVSSISVASATDCAAYECIIGYALVLRRRKDLMPRTLLLLVHWTSRSWLPLASWVALTLRNPPTLPTPVHHSDSANNLCTTSLTTSLLEQDPTRRSLQLCLQGSLQRTEILHLIHRCERVVSHRGHFSTASLHV